MWRLIFVGTLVWASVSADAGIGTVFRKCCSKTQSLVKFSVNNTNSENYECLDRGEIAEHYNVSYSPLVIGDNVTVDSRMPEACDGLHMIQLPYDNLNADVTSGENKCIDILVVEIVNGKMHHHIPKIVALTCIYNQTENSTKSTLAIHHMRKCCPTGFSYDVQNHLCRREDEENSEEWLVRTLNMSSDLIYDVGNGLHCKSDEFGVELSEELYSLKVEGSYLRVMRKNGGGGGLSSHGQWCVDKEFGHEGMVARVCTGNCGAYGAFCIRKCCPIGEHYRPRRCGSPVSKCVPNEDEVFFNVSVYTDPLKDLIAVDVLGIKTDLRCPAGKMMLNRTLKRDFHHLTPQGHLKSPIASNDDYCFEAFDSRHCPSGEIALTAVTCFIKAPSQNKNFQISFVLITISSVCLAMTLIVYCSLPELLNLHGRTLICHVSMMLLAFSCLARVQYSEVPNNKMCIALGYGIYFGFTAAFAWLNVMCLDIWWTFGSMRTVQPMRKAGSECKRFLWYSLYAWSVAVVLTFTMFLLDRFPVADFLDANIGEGMCWFGTYQNSKTDWPHYIFFVIPMGMGTCTNFVLFMLTARHCARVKSEVHRLQAGSVGDRAKRRFRIDKAKYILTGKLWVVMGAGWISELLSTLATHPEWLWSIVDLFNELQGVLIFLILVFKPKLYYLIRKRLGLEKPDAQKPTSSGRTSSTFLSRTISSDERATLRISQNNAKQP